MITLILVGPYAGHTRTLRNIRFTSGRARIEGTTKSLESYIRYMTRSYQAYVEGSDEHKAAAEKWEAEYGQHKTDGETQPGAPNPIQRAVQPYGGGTGPGGDEDGRRHDVDQPGHPGLRPDGSERAGPEAAEGVQGEVATEQEEPEPDYRPAAPKNLIEAISQLEWDNPDHWNKDGCPAVAAVAQIAGVTNLTRERVDAAMPEGFNREVQRELMGGPSPKKPEPAQTP